MQRVISSVFALSFLFTMPAFAGEAEGKIVDVNASAMTVTLDSGETYTLPPEFDVTLVSPGMVVALAHEDDAAKTVTDMELVD